MTRIEECACSDTGRADASVAAGEACDEPCRVSGAFVRALVGRKVMEVVRPNKHPQHCQLHILVLKVRYFSTKVYVRRAYGRYEEGMRKV